MSEEIPGAAVGAFLSAFDQLWRAGTSLEERTRAGLAAAYPHLAAATEGPACTSWADAVRIVQEDARQIEVRRLTLAERDGAECQEQYDALGAVPPVPKAVS